MQLPPARPYCKSGLDPTALLNATQIAQSLRRGLSLAELEERYREENLRKALY